MAGWGSESVQTTQDEQDWTASARCQTKRDLLRDPAFARHIFCEVNKLRRRKAYEEAAGRRVGCPAFVRRLRRRGK
jgi:hypothetical protein